MPKLSKHMKYFFLVLIFLLSFHFKLNAQDTVFVKRDYERFVDVKKAGPRKPTGYLFPKGFERKFYDGDENIVIAKILDIDDFGIEFVKWKTKTPVFKLRSNDIDSVVFANGRIEKFLNYLTKMEYIQKKKEMYKNLDDNIVVAGIGIFGNTFFLLDFNSGKDVTPVLHSYIGYERVFLNDRIGIAITPFIGFSRKAYGSSFTLKYYLIHNKQGRVSLGPLYQISHQNVVESGDVMQENYSGWVRKQYTTTISALGLLCSSQIHFNRNIFLNFEIGTNAVLNNSNRRKYIPSNWNTASEMQYLFRIGLGYRF